MRRIKKIVHKISKKSVVIRNILRKTIYILKKIEYKVATLGIKVDNKTIIFCSFGGKSYSCSPKAIYEFMISEKKYKDYKFIWAFKEIKKYEELEQNINTHLVKIN